MSLSSIAVTKLDVLDDLNEIKIGIAYKYRGERLPSFPGMYQHYSFDIYKDKSGVGIIVDYSRDYTVVNGVVLFSIFALLIFEIT